MVAEGDRDILQIVDEGTQEEVAAAAAPAAEALLPLLLQEKEDEVREKDEGHSAEISTTSIQPTSTVTAVQPYIPADAFTVGPQVDLHSTAMPVVASGYTTLEMLQQATPRGAPASTQRQQ